MTTYKAIIVDDETKLQEVLRIKLERFCPNIEVCGIAANAWDAFDLIKEQQPHIVFLDIAMPKESGFELLKKFEKINFELIFVTGFDQYALDALKLSAVDYILKPVNTHELTEAIQKAIKNIEGRQKIERYEVLKHNLEHNKAQEAKIAIPNNNGHEFVKVADIIRCEGWQKYTKIYLLSGACMVSSYNIGVYKEMLEAYSFYSIHKSHLINQSHIQKYIKSGIVMLSDGSEVPVARRKKETFYQQCIRGKILEHR